MKNRSEPQASGKDKHAEMDRILEKISREGRESLTDEELGVLEETSRKMREERQNS